MENGSLTIEQCLFGYEGGHRLLATSMRVPSEVSSELTLLSDMAPGVKFAGSSGYWTGIPIPALRKYSLMKTWPAPEMPRPGCVWTHALLFDLNFFEEIEDLTSIWDLARRPAKIGSYQEYSKSIHLDFLPLAKTLVPISPIGFSSAIEVLDATYHQREAAVPPENLNEIDRLVFSVWSQQWPILRRNFRFQSAVGTFSQSNSNVKLDLRFSSQFRSADRLHANYSQDGDWLNVAAKDLMAPNLSRLRLFLREYGADVKRPKASFIPLVTIFSIVQKNDWLTGVPLQGILANISDSFPGADDAIRLKQSVLESDGNWFHSDPIDVLRFLLSSPAAQAFPPLNIRNVEKLNDFWFERPSEIFSLVKIASELDSDLANAVVSDAAASIPEKIFWKETTGSIALRARLINENPKLLDSASTINISTDEMISLLNCIPIDANYVPSLFRSLLERDSANLISATLDRFGIVAGREVLKALDHVRAYSYYNPIRSWIQALAGNPKLIFGFDLLSGVRRWSSFLIIIEALDWLSPKVVSHGVKPWLEGVLTSDRDLKSDDELNFLSFFLTLALKSSDREARSFIELCFDIIHQKAENSYLPYRSNRMLAEVLPDLGWKKNRDLALLIRVAVVNKYQELGLGKDDLERVSSDRSARAKLFDLTRTNRRSR